jgi:rubrerythrin
MLEKKPVKEDLSPSDVEIIRFGMISELDAVNLYQQMADSTDNKDLKAVLLDIAKEEKIHFAEFQAMLLKYDGEQLDCNVSGSNEVRLLTGND